MANFKIGVPQHVRDELAKDRANINLEISGGTLPDYPTFVNNLKKGMNTPAEELHHATTGMSGEAGELLDISKKVWIYNKTLDLAHLIEELGDLRFYYQGALNMIGLTDEDIRTQNMKKLRVRYASGSYTDAQANARADKAPLSAEGAKGTGKPEPRRFLGQPELTPAAQAAAQRQREGDPDEVGETSHE